MSLDDTRVVNYAQGHSREDFQAMLEVSAAREHLDAIRGLATAEPKLSTVASVHHAE